MRPDKFLVGLAIFVLFITSGLAVMFGFGNQTGFFDNYNVNVSESHFSNITKEIDEVYDISDEIKSDMVETEISKEESWQDMIKGAYSALKSYISTFSLAGKIITAITIELGIPPFIAYFVMAIISILVMFIIIYMVFRFMPRG